MLSEININTDCKDAFERAKRLIEDRKKQFNRNPEIQEFDNGNILIQFFENWGDYWNVLKRRDFEPINSDTKEIVAIYCEAGKNIDIKNFGKSKTYLIVNGEVEFKFADDTSYKVSSFQSLIVPKNMRHVAYVVRDSYVIVIEQ